MANATAIPEVLELTATSNPYLDFYHEYCTSNRQDLFRVFDASISEKKRRVMYKALDVSVAMKYAWAIPDERALRIIKHYGPIVEMGAGTGYWGRLLQLRGVDIICYDLHIANEEGDEDEQKESEEDEEDDGDHDDQEDNEPEEEGEGEEEEGSDAASDDEEVEVEQIYWMDVLPGTPKVLRKHTDRTLFLCYPDDFEDSSESMALQALHNYSGEYVIHVGELFGQTLCLPGPWGRTSSSEFQVHLASVYHKIIQVPLPSWHSSIDSLTVWKRTKTSIMDNSFYAFIPENERLDLVAACPSTRHLLEETPVASDVTKSCKRKADPTQKKTISTKNEEEKTTTEVNDNANKKTQKKHRKRQKTGSKA